MNNPNPFGFLQGGGSLPFVPTAVPLPILQNPGQMFVSQNNIIPNHLIYFERPPMMVPQQLGLPFPNATAAVPLPCMPPPYNNVTSNVFAEEQFRPVFLSEYAHRSEPLYRQPSEMNGNGMITQPFEKQEYHQSLPFYQQSSEQTELLSPPPTLQKGFLPDHTRTSEAFLGQLPVQIENNGIPQGFENEKCHPTPPSYEYSSEKPPQPPQPPPLLPSESSYDSVHQPVPIDIEQLPESSEKNKNVSSREELEKQEGRPFPPLYEDSLENPPSTVNTNATESDMDISSSQDELVIEEADKSKDNALQIEIREFEQFMKSPEKCPATKKHKKKKKHET